MCVSLPNTNYTHTTGWNFTVLVDSVSTPVATIHPHGYKDATAKTMRDIQQWSITRRPTTPLTNDTYILSSIVLAMASLIFVFHWMRPREDAETLRPDQGVRHAVTRYSSTLYSSCSVCGYYSQDCLSISWNVAT